MKKKFCICILMTAFALFTSCNNPKTSPRTDTSSVNSDIYNSSQTNSESEQYMDSSTQQWLKEELEQNEKILSKAQKLPFSQLITKEYSEQQIFSSGFLFRRYYPTASFQYYMRYIENDFPVECLRQTGTDKAYSIYKTVEGGVVYCFYSKEYSSWVLHHACYVKNALTKKDFYKIKKGVSIEDVAKIDSAFSATKDYTDKQNSTPNHSIHLLKDSLLVINYDKTAQGMVVKEWNFYDDYKYPERNMVYDYQIAEQDYIS